LMSFHLVQYGCCVQMKVRSNELCVLRNKNIKSVEEKQLLGLLL